MKWPQTTEGIALILLYLILADIKLDQGANLPPGTRVLDLYAQCLATVRGERGVVSHDGEPLH